MQKGSVCMRKLWKSIQNVLESANIRKHVETRQRKDKIIQEKDTLLKEALAKIDKEQQSREKLEEQVKELLLQKQCVQNITNNNFIIQINNYGEENMDYLAK